VARSRWLQVKDNGANCGYCLLYKGRENWIIVLLEESQRAKQGKKWKREREGKKDKQRNKRKEYVLKRVSQS